MSYLTVVFKDAKPGSKEVADLLYHPQFAAGSWGHSIDDANFWRTKVEQMPSEVSMNTYEKVDDETVMIDGVKYQKVEEPKPQTLLDIIREWNDDDKQPTCEELVNRIENWMSQYECDYVVCAEYLQGYNALMETLKEYLK